MVEKGPSELEIKPGEEGVEEPKGLIPNAQEDFAAIMRDYGVKEKAAETITRHIADTGSAGVFSDPRELAEKLSRFPRHIPPVTRANILDHWTAINKIPYPEEIREEAEMPAQELKQKKSGKTEEKYSVDTETGAIKVASTTDKAALTWDEAGKLSKEIKKGIEEQEKKAAKAEAKEKAEAKASEGEKESPFLQDSKGNWIINPKARVSGMELLAFEAVRKSQEKGEPADPFEILANQAERIETMRSVFGGGKGGGGFLDSVEDLLKLKTLLGTDEDTKNLLAGIYKKLTEEGGGKGESEEVKGLRTDLKDMREELQQKERERLEGQITNLNTAMTDMRADLARARTEARATDEYGIMSEAIKMVDRRMGAIEGTIRGAMGKSPGLLPAGVKEELTQAISEESVEEQALDKLAEKVFYR